jgi:hypothetical protein
MAFDLGAQNASGMGGPPPSNPFAGGPAGGPGGGPQVAPMADPNRQAPSMDMASMMKDPKFKEMVMQQAQVKKKKKIEDLLNGGGSVQELAAIFPKLQQYQEQKKIADAEKKVEDLKVDNLYKRAEQAHNTLQGAQQMQQGAG